MSSIRNRINNQRLLSEQDAAVPAQASGHFDSNALFTGQTRAELEQLNRATQHLGVEAVLIPTHLPIVEALAKRLRTALHSLSIFYVNLLAEQQRVINVRMSRVLTGITNDIEEEHDLQRHEIMTLREEIAMLRANKDIAQPTDGERLQQ
jgi:hypothetical protein